MQIGEYLRSRSDGEIHAFAKTINVTANALKRYMSRERIPRHAIMCAIYRATRGKVEPNDFYDLPKLRSRKR